MDISHTDLPSAMITADQAKEVVVERTLFQVFNPFSSLPQATKQVEGNASVISYTVSSGDTLSQIASRYGITLRQLMEDNRLANPNVVSIGMKLVMRKNEATHIVSRGETLESISKRYCVTPGEIVARNPLLKILDNDLYIGQSLRIPLPQSKPMLGGNSGLRRQLNEIASRAQTRARLLEWPVAAPTVTSGFGMRWGKMHKGIDIWNEERSRTPILAAKDGTVVEAGATRARYGNLVVVDHGEGLQTMYAHMRKIIVNVGDVVHSGDTLGYMGRTGDSTDYHLHFEVRQDDVPINPMRLLRK